MSGFFDWGSINSSFEGGLPTRLPNPADGIKQVFMSLSVSQNSDSVCSSSTGIVVLSFNHPEITARAVRSALKLHQNIYLVHNGSEKRFVSKLRSEFPLVEHLELDTNVGYSGGVNAGLRLAFCKSDWVILLTNDCILLNLPALPNNPALVAPHIRIKNSIKTDSIGGGFYPRRGQIFHCKELKEFSLAAYKYIPGSAFLIHRNVFSEVGPFDEKLGTYWEDVDFSSRAALHKQNLLVDPEWVVEHARGKTCHKDRHYTLYLFQRNRKRISYKYTSKLNKPILFISLWIAWIKLGFQLILRSRRHDLRLLLRAIRD